MLDFGAAHSTTDDASAFDLFPAPAPTTGAPHTSRRHDFHSVDSERNRARFYRLVETTTLFGECCLVVEYGRVATALCKRRTEYFCDEFSRRARFSEIVAVRKSHGYVLVHTA